MVKRKGAAAAKPAAAKKRAAPAEKATPESLFNSYRDDAEDQIGPEGIEKLCKDLGITPADRKILLLAWKMDAQRMGYLSRAEFIKGFHVIGATTLAQMKKALPKLANMASKPADFQDFYSFAFKFCLMEPGQRIIDASIAAEMLPIVYPSGRFVKQFCQFLVEQDEYKKISVDQWQSFLIFSQEVRVDMSNAGDNPAWPVLLDSFVDWYQNKGGCK